MQQTSFFIQPVEYNRADKVGQNNRAGRWENVEIGDLGYPFSMTEDAAITYLGTAGWHISLSGVSLLFDPYFSRIAMWDMLFFRRAGSLDQVRKYCPPASAIFASHGHYDHIMDIPLVAEVTGAPVYCSPQSAELLRITGLPADRVRLAEGGATIHPFDGASVEVYEVPHRKMLGRVPANGALRRGLKPPLNGWTGYRMDRLFSFRLLTPSVRILILNGVDDEPDCEADILIVGPDISDDALSHLLTNVKPSLVMPNHWDDMFQSLSEPPRPQRRMDNPLRRMDPDLFISRVTALLPSAQVLLPGYFRPLSYKGDLPCQIIAGKHSLTMKPLTISATASRITRISRWISS